MAPVPPETYISPVAKSISHSISPSTLHSPMCIYVCHEVMLGKGEGKGVATQPNVPISKPSRLHICTRRRGKGPYFKDFACGQIFSNNDVAINIQS